MATWKKIITSGSNADLNQITASAVKFPNDSISGDVITGGTIGSTTITALAGALSLGDNNITNVGDINADSISIDAAGTGLNIDFSGGNTTKNLISLKDNLADALNITEGSNSYIKFTTTNSSEKILVSKDTEFLGNASGSITSTGSFGHLIGDGSQLTGVSTDIDSVDAFSGVPHATQDEFLMSDNGTEKRATMTMVANGGFALVSGDATIAAGGALTIAATAVENGMLADNAVDTEEIADNAVTTAKITDANVTLAKIANAAANTVIVRDANSSGVLSAKAVTNTQILIGDGTGFTAAALSGDVTMTNGGAVTIANNAVEEAMIANNAVGNDQMADNAIGNAELKQNDDITLQSLTLTGDLTVNGTTTTIATTNTKVEDKFMFLATGSAGTNTDAGIMVQSGSVDLSGSAFYHDVNVVAGTNPNGGRWSVAKSVGQDVGAVNPLQFVTTVKTETVNPNSTSGSYGAGEMHVNTTTGDIWIRFG